MSKKKEYRLNKFSLIMSVVATAFAGLTFFRSYQTEKDLAETNYKLSSITHMPRIKFQNPRLVRLDLIQDTTVASKPSHNTDTLDISMNIRPTLKVQLLNTGNSDAKIIGYVLTDTISDYQIIKEYIKNGKAKGVSIGDIFTKHRYHQLSPGDTSSMSFMHTLNPVNKKFVMHLIVYYENELGQLYDSYYWLTGKLNEFGFGQAFDTKTQKLVFLIDKNAFSNIIEFTSENNFSDVYSVDQKEATLKYLSTIANQ